MGTERYATSSRLSGRWWSGGRIWEKEMGHASSSGMIDQDHCSEELGRFDHGTVKYRVPDGPVW